MEIDEFTAKINERNERSILPIIEDLADWLASFLHLPIKANNFLDILDNGVVLCKLAEKIQKHSYDYIHGNNVCRANNKTKMKSLPLFQYKYHSNAKRETFFARENAASFIKWCKSIGIQDSTLFESEGLVFQKEIKNIVNSLLELARIAFRYELQPIPSLIKMEHEIDEEEKNDRANVTIRKKKHVKVKGLDTIDMKVRGFIFHQSNYKYYFSVTMDE